MTKLYFISVNTGEYTYMSILSAPGFCNVRLCVMCVCMQAMSRHAFGKSATHCKSWWRTDCNVIVHLPETDRPWNLSLFHKMLNVIDLFVNTIYSVNHVKALLQYYIYCVEFFNQSIFGFL